MLCSLSSGLSLGGRGGAVVFGHGIEQDPHHSDGTTGNGLGGHGVTEDEDRHHDDDDALDGVDHSMTDGVQRLQGSEGNLQGAKRRED